MENKEIGKRIEKSLVENNISQRELSKMINLDETIMSRIISGGRTPRSEVIANIATALHVTTDYLLNGDGEVKFDSKNEIRLIARNSSKFTEEEKRELIDILLQ